MNVHQDLHFSTFYLRASLSSNTLPDYPGYSLILALYEDGIERYFIPAQEAERTSKWLINRSVSDPDWLAKKLSAIEVHSRRLADAFPDTIAGRNFHDTSIGKLIAI